MAKLALGVSPRPAIIDTNVVVSGLLTRDPSSPTARILDGMLGGGFTFLLSPELFAEYRSVLLRPRVQALHKLREDEVDEVLAALANRALWLEPGAPVRAPPDPGDAHLWVLLEATPEALLVTGDRLLLQRSLRPEAIVSPRAFLETA